jgi:hypothetical protein
MTYVYDALISAAVTAAMLACAAVLAARAARKAMRPKRRATVAGPVAPRPSSSSSAEVRP